MRTLVSFAADSSDFVYSDVLDGTEYRLRFWWSERGKAWHFDILEPDETPIVCGVRLVVYWPLLYRHSDARLPLGQLLCVDTQTTINDITRQAELGDDVRGGRCRIVYLTKDDVDALEATVRPSFISSIEIGT